MYDINQMFPYTAIPRWSKQLKSIVTKENSQVTFTVMAVGTGILRYDWFKNGQPINVAK